MPDLNLSQSTSDLIKPLKDGFNSKFVVIVLGLTVALGVVTGFVLANKSPQKIGGAINTGPAKAAEQDSKTFKDFATGTIKPKPSPANPSQYTEGTHLLVRDKETSVALTSSVVDLSKYEGKKVKVYGETQKAITEGWLMDVGKVEEIP